MYVHLGFDKGVLAMIRRGTDSQGDDIGQTKESAENDGDNFFVDCVDNHLSTTFANRWPFPRTPPQCFGGSRRGRQLAANLTLLNMECSNLEYKKVALEALSRSHTAARHTHFLASIDIQQLHFCNR